MPRQAHGRPLQSNSSRPHKRKHAHKNVLSALELAEQRNPNEIKVRHNRLGEVEGDYELPLGRKDAELQANKRRKTEDGGNEVGALAIHNEEEQLASGSDDEGGRWHEGVDGSEEDSDIDSDEAFGESDEENFANFAFGGSRSSGQRPKNRRSRQNIDFDDENDSDNNVDVYNESRKVKNDDDEAQDDYSDDDEFEENAIDLATALDMNLKEEQKAAEKARKKTVKKQSPIENKALHHESSTEDDDDNDESDHADDSDLSVSDDDMNGDNTGLQSFVASLAEPTQTLETKNSSSNRLLSGNPSSFGLGGSKVSAADLMQYIKDPVQRQSLRTIQASERSGPEDYKGGIPGRLSVPLAQRQQDKLDRAAAFTKSKETLDRWTDTIKANRRAEHISFPLIDPGSLGAKSAKQLSINHLNVPQTKLEAAVQNILFESGVITGDGKGLEDQEAAFEELEEKKIPLEDVRERRAQLRLARDLMFREEIRAKRIKKIKSKAYRRVHRKERDKIEAQQRERLSAAGLLDSDEEREKNDRRRAEERMGARHKESKWAKGVKQAGRAAWDEDARTGVLDLAKRDEELRRRIDGRKIGDSDTSDVESDFDTQDSDTEHQRIDDQLRVLEASGDGLTSKLGSMAFMQRADAAQKAKNDEEIQQFKLASRKGPSVEHFEEVEALDRPGRQRYGMSKEHDQDLSRFRAQRNELEAPLSENEPVTDSDEDKKSLRTTRTADRGSKTTSKASSRQLAGKVVDHNSKSKSTADTTNAMARPSTKARNQVQVLESLTSPSESEDETPTTPTADSTQAALAASIFAGPDDVVGEFEKEKQEAIEDEDDQVVDNTLPGWGNWTGVGVGKKQQKRGKGRFLTTIKGISPDKRKDAKLDKVIVNEKRIKKNGKYLANELPHPFESRQQYERSLRLPMGPEWSTVNHYQDAIKPRVLLKQGIVIKPIAKPSR